jgi:hypothetical protein
LLRSLLLPIRALADLEGFFQCVVGFEILLSFVIIIDRHVVVVVVVCRNSATGGAVHTGIECCIYTSSISLRRGSGRIVSKIAALAAAVVSIG